MIYKKRITISATRYGPIWHVAILPYREGTCKKSSNSAAPHLQNLFPDLPSITDLIPFSQNNHYPKLLLCLTQLKR